MGKEDVKAGQSKQAKGKVKEVKGAATGDTSEEVKGKIEKNIGKGQEKAGRKKSA